jgi:multiple sugar transport system permease protein
VTRGSGAPDGGGAAPGGRPDEPGRRLRPRGGRLGRAALRGATYAVTAAAAAAMVMPLYLMFTGGLKTPSEFVAIPMVWWPRHPQWGNYAQVWHMIPLARMFANSLAVTGSITLMILFTSSLAGFAFAKYRFPGRDALFVFVLATMMVPFFVLLIPTFWIVHRLGLLDSYGGLILPNVVTGFGIFLMRQFTLGIPDELLDAARIDGASEWWIYLRIVLPLTRPALAALGIFAFTYHWDNFLWPTLVINSPKLYTVPVGLSHLATFENREQYQNLIMAASTLAVLPSVTVFLALQRYFVRGITLTGLKG